MGNMGLLVLNKTAYHITKTKKLNSNIATWKGDNTLIFRPIMHIIILEVSKQKQCPNPNSLANLINLILRPCRNLCFSRIFGKQLPEPGHSNPLCEEAPLVLKLQKYSNIG